MPSIIEKLKRKYPELQEEPMLDELSASAGLEEPSEEEEDLGMPSEGEEDLGMPSEDEEDMDMLAGAEEEEPKAPMPMAKKLARKMPPLKK